MQVRVTVWDSLQNRKLTGIEAPTEKELALFLQRHPHCEIYCGQRAAPVAVVEPAEAPLKSNFMWVDKPLAGKWDKPLKPRPADLAPKRPTEGGITMDPSLLAKRARVEQPGSYPPAAAPAAAALAAAAPAAAAPTAAAFAQAPAAATAAPDAAPAAAPDGPGVIFVPLVVSSFAAVAEQMAAYMSHPAVRRSLACLAQGAEASQMPMPFIPLSSLGPQKAATPAAATAASDESDRLLASLLDAAGADQPGSDGPLCISSLFDDSECAALGAALHSHTTAPAPPPPAHRFSAGQHAPRHPAPAPPARAASRAAAGRSPAAMPPSSSMMLLPRGPAVTVPPSAFTSGECGYPYCDNKGWFAFNESGKGIFLLERLFLMLSMPQQSLAKHPGKRMRDAIRWMDRATADAHGVPAGSVGFELVDPMLFSDEVYPQWRSGSFRKTAKHWGLTSPKPKQHSVRKLTPKCMYLPVHDEHDQAAVDLEGAFKPLPPNGGLHGLHDYIKGRIRCLPQQSMLRYRLPCLHTPLPTPLPCYYIPLLTLLLHPLARPLEESIKAKASSSSGTPRSNAVAVVDPFMMEVDDVLLPLAPSLPVAHRSPTSHISQASQAAAAAAAAAAAKSSGLSWHCNTLL